MRTSKARIAANRENARKSTGPRTAEGKARSRVNARKHGLTGDGVALPAEDSAAVAGRFEGMMAEFAPTTVAGGVLVKRAAMLSVRLDRAYEQETANLSARALSAESDLRDRRLAEAEHLLKEIKQNPLTNQRRLLATPEGVELMIRRWEAMKADLDNPQGCQWVHDHHELADALTGRICGTHIDVTPFYAWTMAIHGDFDCLLPERLAGLVTMEEKAVHAMNQVADLVEAEIAGLRAHRAAMDTRPIEAERSFATKRALFDPSPQAVLARRYEAAAARGFHQALAELRQVEAEAAARPPMAVAEAAEAPTQAPSPEGFPPGPRSGAGRELGSFGRDGPGSCRRSPRSSPGSRSSGWSTPDSRPGSPSAAADRRASYAQPWIPDGVRGRAGGPSSRSLVPGSPGLRWGNGRWLMGDG